MKKQHLSIVLGAILIVICLADDSVGEVRLPAVISDNMVLQHDTKVPIWGWAEPGQKVQINGSWSSQNWSAVADKDGKWMVKIDTPEKPGEPFEMVVKGENTIKIKNILAGEVWLCSGQSNMEMPLGPCDWSSGVFDYQQVVAEADYPQIRLFNVERDVAEEPKSDCVGKWVSCDSQNAINFSAAAYFFGRELHKELNVPIGLVHSSWAGTSIEAWMRKEVLESDPDYSAILARRYSSIPTVQYNAMLAPLIGYGIRGVIWYQGESNVNRAYQYRKLFPLLIKSWRDEWGQGEFPFYYVQIAPCVGYEPPLALAELREAQLMAMSMTNTGMAVTMDIGNLQNVHPQNKKDVGKRLAFWALAKTYGRTGIVCSGPIYKSMKVEKKAVLDSGIQAYEEMIRLSFDYIGGGLMVKGDKPTHFEVAGEDRKYVEAQAVIDGDTVVVGSDKVKNPVAVRYAWGDTVIPNLFNKEGLPASPFRTDDWPGVTFGKN